jgi:hypothetical protein
MKTVLGHNQDLAYEHSENHLLEFFSKAGSLMIKKQKATKTRKGNYCKVEVPTSYYGEGTETTALTLFKTAWRGGDYLKCLQLMFNLRNPRGGNGNRSGFRQIVNWLANNYPDYIVTNIALIPKYGRWDDLYACYNTPGQTAAMMLWAQAITNQDGLACKWADRKDKKLADFMGLEIGAFRRLVVCGSKTVEQQMCANEWEDIDHEHVPSVAMARYTNAFNRHCPQFSTFKEEVKAGTKEIKAGAVFPHDLVRTVLNGDPEVADLQFKALPNFLLDDLGKTKKMFAIADVSGSMNSLVSGSIRAVDVALSLALYCSDKIGENNYFYRKFQIFSTDNIVIDWKNNSFSGVVTATLENRIAQSTDIYAALDRLRQEAVSNNVSKEDMIDTLLIVSDMQFDNKNDKNDFDETAIGGSYDSDYAGAVESAMCRWEETGYNRPKIVYWNLCGYEGQQCTMKDKNVCLVSGFSPSVLTGVLSGEMDPIKVMLRTIAKYDDVRV